MTGWVVFPGVVLLLALAALVVEFVLEDLLHVKVPGRLVVGIICTFYLAVVFLVLVGAMLLVRAWR